MLIDTVLKSTLATWHMVFAIRANGFISMSCCQIGEAQGRAFIGMLDSPVEDLGSNTHPSVKCLRRHKLRILTPSPAALRVQGTLIRRC